ncbi:glycosyltransferase family 2 protein [Vibrio owensii]|uniref:glycosyltransferase family 2 protein n=1 Tax=Vibrio owensii TaxID=696485 RepID=UPI003769E329
MSHKPIVSIVMPAFNARKTIKKSIQSIINQTFKHWELIVVDDCSTDDTVDIVKRLEDERIRLYSTVANSGSPAQPRNIGLDKSNGKYIAFLDADDLWYEEKLDHQLKFMLENEISFSCTGYKIVKNGVTLKTFTPKYKTSYKQLLSNNQIGCLTAMVRSDVIQGMRFPVCGHEDFAFWLNVLKKTSYVYGNQKILADYNLVEGSVSSNKFKMFRFFWNIYRNEEGFSFFYSLFLCFTYFINVTTLKYKRC